MRHTRQIGYFTCAIAAAVLLLVGWLISNPPHEAISFESIHPAYAVKPMVGFGDDSLVNTGDAKALDTLPGVGEVIAQRIIETRAYLNGFRLPEDLLLVKGIGEKTLEKIMETLQESLVRLEELNE